MERFSKKFYGENNVRLEGKAAGIAFGMIAHVVISLFCGDAKKIKGSTWVITALFIAMLLLTH